MRRQAAAVLSLLSCRPAACCSSVAPVLPAAACEVCLLPVATCLLVTKATRHAGLLLLLGCVAEQRPTVPSAPPSPPTQIEANFGTDLTSRPFRGDVAWIKHEAQQRLYASVLNTAVPRSAKVGSRAVCAVHALGAVAAAHAAVLAGCRCRSIAQVRPAAPMAHWAGAGFRSPALTRHAASGNPPAGSECNRCLLSLALRPVRGAGPQHHWGACLWLPSPPRALGHSSGGGT